MIELIPLADDFGEFISREEIVKEEWREVKELLPLSFLAKKTSEAGNCYIFLISYKAYPLYAIVNEETRRVTITRTEPSTDGFTLLPDASEDDIVFPYLDYYNIITKALLTITSNKHLWVPIFGASNYCMEVTGLDRETFQERVREVLSLRRRPNEKGYQERRTTTSRNNPEIDESREVLKRY